MTEPSLDEVRRALREGRATEGLPTDEEIQQAVEGSPNRNEFPPPSIDIFPPRFDPAELRGNIAGLATRAQPPSPPAPVPSPSVLSRSNAIASQLSANLFGRLALLALALAFAAAPLGLMYLWAPVFNHNQHNIIVDFIGLGLGVGCLAWLCAGFAAVLGAIGNLFSD